MTEYPKNLDKREILLRRVIEAIKRAPDLKAVKQAIVDEIGRTFKADRCFFRSYDKIKDDFTKADAEYRSSSDVISAMEVEPDTEGIKYFLERTKRGQPIFYMKNTDEYIKKHNLQGSAVERYLEENSIKSDYPFPMWDRKKNITYLVLHYVKKPVHLSKKDLDLLQILADQAVNAIDLSTFYKDLQECSEREKLLRGIADTIRSTLDVNKVKKNIVSQVGKAFGFDRCAIMSFDQVKKKFLPVDEQGLYMSINNIASHIGIDIEKKEFRSFKKRFQYEDKELFIPDIENPAPDIDPTIIKILKSFNIKSNYTVIIKYRGQLLGILYTNFVKEKRELTSSEIKLLESIAAQAGIAFYQANLYEKEKQTVKRERLLREITATISSTLDFNKVRKTLVTRLGETLGSDFNIFYILDPDTEKFVPVDEYSVYLSSPKIESPVGVNIVEYYGFGDFFRSNEMTEVIYPDIEDFKKDYNLYGTICEEFLDRYKIKSSIVIPIKCADRLLGILGMNYARRYKTVITEEDKNLVRAVAAQAGIALYQAKLFEQFKQKAELEEKRKTYLATLIHDLRSPVLSEQKALEFVLSRKKDATLESFSDFLSDIYETNRELLSIINNIMDLYSFESGEFKLNIKINKIEDIINESIKSIKYLIAENESVVNINLPPDLPEIEVDGGKIKRVLTNLINNAVKHNPKGTEIIISAEKINKTIQVSVKDNGRGIDEAEKDKIFQQFPTLKGKLGTGLGLYLSKLIVEAHNGEIWFETGSRKGTVFYFSLPNCF